MVRINLIHAAFNAGNVDICLDGDIVLSDVAYSDYANFAEFAGRCFSKLEVKATGTSTVLATLNCFTFPCYGDYTLVIHWNLDESVALITCFDNSCFRGNFLLRHAAGIGPVHLFKTNVSPPIQVYSDVALGDILRAVYFPEGTNEIEFKLADDDSTLLVVEDLEIAKDKLTILYLTGGTDNELSTVVETIDLPDKDLTYWCKVYNGPCSPCC